MITFPIHILLSDFITSGGEIDLPLIGNTPLHGFLLILVGIPLILGIFKLLSQVLSNIVKYRLSSPNIYTIIIFLLRLGEIFLISWIILTIIPIPPDYVLIISSILTTAIVFASVNSLNNFIAGVWINFSNPFEIGDYIRIGVIEGVVIDIQLTNTIIKHKDRTITHVPNTLCLRSNITNFSISLEKTQKKIHDLKNQLIILQKSKKRDNAKNSMIIKTLTTEIAERDFILRELLQAQRILKDEIENVKNGGKNQKLLKNFTGLDTFIKYTFYVELPKTLQANQKILEKTCQIWGEKFLVPPKVALLEITSHFKYQITVLTPDSQYILEYLDEFSTDIYVAIYSND